LESASSVVVLRGLHRLRTIPGNDRGHRVEDPRASRDQVAQLALLFSAEPTCGVRGGLPRPISCSSSGDGGGDIVRTSGLCGLNRRWSPSFLVAGLPSAESLGISAAVGQASSRVGSRLSPAATNREQMPFGPHPERPENLGVQLGSDRSWGVVETAISTERSVPGAVSLSVNLGSRPLRTKFSVVRACYWWGSRSSSP
jgi:hypothetical protein